MKQFDVTGMSCAACSARVEKAVKEVPGVTECTVSLLTNSLSVNGSADEGAIIAAVERAGYGASAKGANKAAQEEELKDKSTPQLKRRLIWSVGFLMILMYFSMGHMMWGLAAAEILQRQPCGNGPYSAAAYRDNHGNQPEVLHKRL